MPVTEIGSVEGSSTVNVGIVENGSFFSFSRLGVLQINYWMFKVGT